MPYSELYPSANSYKYAWFLPAESKKTKIKENTDLKLIEGQNKNET